MVSTSLEVSSIVNALSIISNPLSGNESRRASEKFIEDVKTSDSLVPMSLVLVNVSSNFSLDVRSFGLHFLEHALLTRWNTWSPQEQLDFRQSIVKLLFEGLSTSPPEKRLVKEKIASLIVAIAIRTWPQQWPDFLSFLETLFQSSAQLAPIEISLFVIKTFAEDVFIYDNPHLDETRLHELKAALIAESPALLGLVAGYMKKLANTFTTLSTVDSVERQTHELVLIESIHVWTAYVEWAPFQIFKETLIIEFMSECLVLGSGVFDAILEVFIILVGRSCKIEEQSTILLPIMNKQESFCHYLQSLITQGYSDELYCKLKKLGQLYHDLGTRQLSYKKTQLLNDKNFMYFLQGVLLLTQHESDCLCSMMLELWSSALKSENITKNGSFVGILPQLVNTLTGRLMELYKKPSHLTEMAFNMNDFDDVKEYEQFLSVLRTRLCEIIRAIAKLNPPAMLELGIQGADALLSMPYEQSNVGKNPIGCTATSPYFKAIESSCLFFMAIFHGLSASIQSEAHVQGHAGSAAQLGYINRIVKRLLEFPYEDALCLTKLLDPMIEGSLLLKKEHSSLPEIITKVMSLVSFVPSKLTTMSDKGDNKASLTLVQKEIAANLRRKAASCLVKLAEGFSEQFVPFYQSLFGQIQSLITNETVGLGERTSLIEFLMVIGQKVPVEEDRLLCLQFVCGPLLEAWKSDDISRALQSTGEFIQYIGANFIFSQGLATTPKTTPLGYLETAQSHRSTLSYLVHTSLVVLKRLENRRFEATNTYSSLFAQLVTPNIFRVLSMLDSLWLTDQWPVESQSQSRTQSQSQLGPPPSLSNGQTEARSSVSSSQGSPLGRLLELSMEEKKNLLGYGGFSRDDGPSETQLDKLIVNTKIWLGSIRVTSYQWIEQMCTNATNYQLLGTYWDVLFGALFSGKFQVRFWKPFLQTVVSPLVLKCPETLYGSHLAPWLTLFIIKTTEYLDYLWKQFSRLPLSTKAAARRQPVDPATRIHDLEHDDDNNNNTDDDVIDELLHERLLRSTTHVYAILFLDIFFPLSERNQILQKTTPLLAAPASHGGHAFSSSSSSSSSPLLAFMVAQADAAPADRSTATASATTTATTMLQAFLQTLLVFFSWKDSYTVEKAITICQRLLIHLAGRPQYCHFFGNALFTATLHTLSDGYHQELYDSAIALLCSLFASYRTDAELILASIPALYANPPRPPFLQGSPPLSSSPLSPASMLAQFTAKFDAESDQKKRKVLTKLFLKPILGLKQASLFKLDDSLAAIKSLPTRLIFQQQQQQQQQQHHHQQQQHNHPSIWDWNNDDPNNSTSPSFGLSDFFTNA